VFGPHLIIDGSRCDTRKLGDRILVEQILAEYPTAIGMTKIGGPYMFEYQAPDPAYSGISGLVVIAESHIAIHTFPELDYFTMDVFSCKNFDIEKAISFIRDAFDVKEMDRMLVQRGLSFRGPHHGEHGATDELIAAAEARLAAGIVSKETVDPAQYGSADIRTERDAAAARRGGATLLPGADAGRMLWPQYGVTPDYGSYGAAAGAHTHVPSRAGGVLTSGAEQAPVVIEAVQVNPTASVSGLLDKLSTTGGQARRLGQALASWESLARDPDTTIALALSTPVIAAGMRELLVFAVEHRYADLVIASSEDLAADVYEALGFTHVVDGDGVSAPAEGVERVRSAMAAFLDGSEPGSIGSAADLWRGLGAWLAQHAPRKGVLQAAAAAGVPLFVPDLASGLFGTLLLEARSRGAAVTLDPAEDSLALARAVCGTPRLGIVRVGEGPADALVAQARDIASSLDLAEPTLTHSVSLGTSRALGAGEWHVALAADATLALPLIVTGLAQRVPGVRHPATPIVAKAQEPALA
jgi:S-adenosylmethionine decarboxylase